MNDFIKQFPKASVLVVGDVMADLYIYGEVKRISPEAPVPVVAESSRFYALGGASNVAHNIVALGGRATLVGVVGNDAEGKIIKRLCRRVGIKTFFVMETSRPTTTKTRALAKMGVIGRHHHLLRIDREQNQPLNPVTEKKLVQLIKKLPAYAMVIISDYAKGVLTPAVMRALEQRFGKKNIVADFKPIHGPLYRGVRVIVPNLKEAHELTGVYPTTNQTAEKVARQLQKNFASAVVLKRGEQGVTIYEGGKNDLVHLPAQANKISDVTGAGDTVIAALTLALASGVSLMNAVKLANQAAGIVVGREGTAVVTAADLKQFSHD